ncbi:MAG TPA: hypothetical protein VGP07_00630 [Polyangia bacterium]
MAAPFGTWPAYSRPALFWLLLTSVAPSPTLAQNMDDGGATDATTAAADPPVETICRAAAALALAEPERARGYINRARAAGWLPEFRFRVFRRFARTEGLTLDDTATTTPVDVSGVDDVRYEWRATWDLSRMVFNPDELQAHAEALRMSDVRRDIQSLVIRLYFERRRLLTPVKEPTREPSRADATRSASATAESANDVRSSARQNDATDAAPAEGQAGERRRLRVLEIEAQLEALSGVPFFHQGHGKTKQWEEATP